MLTVLYSYAPKMSHKLAGDTGQGAITGLMLLCFGGQRHIWDIFGGQQGRAEAQWQGL